MSRSFLIYCLTVIFILPGMPANAEPGSGPAPLALVDSLWTHQRRGEAHAAVDSLLPVARTDAHLGLVAGLQLRRGLMYAALGNGRDAEAPLREALALAEARSDTSTTCSSLRWLAVALGHLGRLDEACPLYERQRDLARRANLPEQEAWAAVGMGYCAERHGEMATARADYRLAGTMFAKLGRLQAELFTLNSYGNVCSAQGDYQSALDCYQRTATLSAQLGNIFLQAAAANNLGTLDFQLGDPGQAAASFHRAAELFLQDGSRREEMKSRLNEALCAALAGRHDQAREILMTVIQVAEENDFHDQLSEAQGRLATALWALGAPEKAASDLRSILAEGDYLSPETRCDLAIQLAEITADVEGPEAGLEVLERYIRNHGGPLETGRRVKLATVRGRLQWKAGQNLDALTTLLTAADEAERLGLVGHQLQALPAAAAAARNLGRDSLALDLLERARDSWLSERGLPADPEWREIYGAQGRLVATELAALRLDVEGSGPGDPGPGMAMTELQTFKARTLRERMLGPGAHPRAESNFDLPTFQREVLAPGEVFLDCAMGPERTFLFAVTKTDCRVVELPGDKELGGRLRLFHELLSGPARGERQVESGRQSPMMSRAAESLRQDLLAPIQGMIASAKSIVFCPDGSLNLLPLSLLLESDGIQPAGGISRVPAAAVLVDLRRLSGANSGEPVSVAIMTGTVDGQGRSLPGVRRELQVVRGFGGSSVEPGEDDEGAPVLPAAEVLHIAAHATVNDQSPWRSAIHLDRAGSSKGWELTAGNIAGLKLDTRLVVLSSCETAGGRILNGEGVQGLGSAFLAAGAPAVLATLWPVDDQASARLVDLFYRALGRGDSPALALAVAQAEMAGDSRWSDPYFRHGFVLLGDGRHLVPLKKTGSPVALSAGLSALAGVGVLMVLLRRKTKKGGA